MIHCLSWVSTYAWRVWGLMPPNKISCTSTLTSSKSVQCGPHTPRQVETRRMTAQHNRPWAARCGACRREECVQSCRAALSTDQRSCTRIARIPRYRSATSDMAPLRRRLYAAQQQMLHQTKKGIQQKTQKTVSVLGCGVFRCLLSRFTYLNDCWKVACLELLKRPAHCWLCLLLHVQINLLTWHTYLFSLTSDPASVIYGLSRHRVADCLPFLIKR